MTDNMNTRQQTLQNYSEEATRMVKPLLVFVGILWLLEIIDALLFRGALDGLGIIPRQVDGLRGIVFAPFLHGGWSHLFANTLPLLLFGFLVMLRYRRRFLFISIVIALVSGLGTWLIAPANTLHIGASGLIFGYFAFLIVNAWYERSLASVALALLVIVLYGGILWGVLPTGNSISWQGHFFGLVGGGVAAYYVSPRRV
jgi:membrane associated rhomboid family serine protease